MTYRTFHTEKASPSHGAECGRVVLRLGRIVWSTNGNDVVYRNGLR